MTGRHWRRTFGSMAVAVGLATSNAGPEALAWDQGAGHKGQEIADNTDKDRPATPPEASPAPGELAREGLAKMLQALDKLIESVPQYQMPEITENGDIILRRKRPEAGPQPQPSKPKQPDQPEKRGI